jgi:hypothetical protein
VHPDRASMYYKYFMILTMRQLLVKLVHGLKDMDKHSSHTSLTSVTENIIKSLSHTIMYNAQSGWANHLHIEIFTQLLADLSQDSQEVSFHFKPQILEIFAQPTFFQQTECALSIWQTVVRRLSLANRDVLDNLLLQYGKVGGLFTSTGEEFKQKSLVFKRLAFVVFSSGVDEILDVH